MIVIRVVLQRKHNAEGERQVKDKIHLNIIQGDLTPKEKVKAKIILRQLAKAVAQLNNKSRREKND